MNTWAGKLLGWLSLAAMISFNAPAATYYVNVSNTAPVSPFTDWATAATNIQDAVDVSTDGDLILVTNGLYRTGGATAGQAVTNRVAITNAVTVKSINGPVVTIIQGYQVPGITNGTAAVRCVYIATNAILSGFTLTNGATQFGGWGGGIYCVASNTIITNCIITGNAAGQGGGIYGKGWVLDSQVIRNFAGNNGGGCNAFANGENMLWLSGCTLAGNIAGVGGGGVQAAWLTNCLLQTNYARAGGGGAVGGALYNCTLIGNYATDSGSYGGGVDSSKMDGCVLIGNHANFGGGASYVYLSSGITNCVFLGNYANRGGGIYLCDAYNCVFFTNSATTYGGAAYDPNLYNCVVVSNTAGTSGGGTYATSSSFNIRNSILYYNTAPASPNYSGGSVGNCCVQAASQSPYYITNEPAFVDWPNGDFHLQSNSLCINGGNNASVGTVLDLDGNPRNAGGTVDIGAYEFQSPASTLSYAWAQRYGLPTDGSADIADTDGDQMSNFAEWKSGTTPTNAASMLKMLSATNSLPGMVVKWQSVGGITYYLQRSSDLAGGFTSIVSNRVGQVGSTSYTDTTATNAGPYFYRVGVQ